MQIEFRLCLGHVTGVNATCNPRGKAVCKVCPTVQAHRRRLGAAHDYHRKRELAGAAAFKTHWRHQNFEKSRLELLATSALLRHPDAVVELAPAEPRRSFDGSSFS